MKNIYLFLSLVLSAMTSFSQTLTGPSGVIPSGSTVTLTANGENNSSYISSVVYDQSLMTSSSPDVFGSNWVTGSMTTFTNYNSSSHAPTTVQMHLTNAHTTSTYTVTLKFRIVISSNIVGVTPQSAIATSVVTVGPGAYIPPTFQNVAASASFMKEGCPAGTEGESKTYTVAANTYSSTVSQAAANAAAAADIAANGQTYANTNGACLTLYYNNAITKAYFKNNCGPEWTFVVVPFNWTIAANLYTSTISQGDADLQAEYACNIAGQNNANDNGSCYYCPACEDSE